MIREHCDLKVIAIENSSQKTDRSSLPSDETAKLTPVDKDDRKRCALIMLAVLIGYMALQSGHWPPVSDDN